MEFDYPKSMNKPFKFHEMKPFWKKPEQPILPLPNSIYNNKFERVGTQCGDNIFNTLGSKIGTIGGINYEKPMALMPLPSMASPFMPASPLPKYTGW